MMRLGIQLKKSVVLILWFGSCVSVAQSTEKTQVIKAKETPKKITKMDSKPSEQKKSVKITESQKKSLKREFDKALAVQLMAIRHQHELELQQLRQLLQREKKDFLSNIQPSRMAHFNSNRDVDLRRDYLLQEKQRIQAFYQKQKQQLEARKKEQAERIQKIQEQQRLKKMRFMKALSRNELPAQDLWPNEY